MAFFGAVLGGMVQLTCPHCHVLQVRGRGPLDGELRCRECHRTFKRREGNPRLAKIAPRTR